MKISCLQENLARGLGSVSRAVATRSTLPVLSNILLETDMGRLRLAATNFENRRQYMDRCARRRGGQYHRARPPAHRIRQFSAARPHRHGTLRAHPDPQPQVRSLRGQYQGHRSQRIPRRPHRQKHRWQQQPTSRCGYLPPHGRSGSLCRRDRREPPHPYRRSRPVPPGRTHAGCGRRVSPGRDQG